MSADPILRVMEAELAQLRKENSELRDAARRLLDLLAEMPEPPDFPSADLVEDLADAQDALRALGSHTKRGDEP